MAQRSLPKGQAGHRAFRGHIRTMNMAGLSSSSFFRQSDNSTNRSATLMTMHIKQLGDGSQRPAETTDLNLVFFFGAPQ